MSAEAVWSEFSGRLRAFIASRVRSPEDADDLLQEVFLRIHRSSGTLERADRLPAWLFQITRNALTDYYRARDARTRHLGGASEEEAGEPPIPVDEGRDEQELAACLIPMLEQLSATYREAVTLTAIDGVSQTDAAKRLGLSISGMKSRTQRGRAELRKVLLRCCEVDFDRRGGVAAFRSRTEDGGGCGNGGCSVLRPRESPPEGHVGPGCPGSRLATAGVGRASVPSSRDSSLAPLTPYRTTGSIFGAWRIPETPSPSGRSRRTLVWESRPSASTSERA